MRIPIWSSGIVLLAAIVYSFPAVQEWLVYDRAAILRGELWRVFTWPLVHFTDRHFVYDTLAFGIAGGLVEVRGIRRFGKLCWLISGVGAAVMLMGTPQLLFCGGLSALATGALVFLCLHGIAERNSWGWICRIGLVVASGKIVLETVFGTSLIPGELHPSLVMVPATHVTGAVVAVGMWLWTRRRNDSSFSIINTLPRPDNA